MIYQEINECFKNCREHLEEGGVKITSIVLKNFNIPESVKSLIKADYKLVSKLVDFYYEDFKLRVNNYNNLIEALDQINFIKIKSNNKKIKLIEYNDIILPWLKSGKFFINIFEEYCPTIIDSEEIQALVPINEFIPRENQKEAFDRLEQNGLETSIHCQATGCGKSFIIIRYIDYAFRKVNNPKIILFTERVNILSDLFSFQKGKVKVDMDKLNYWKNIGVGDLTNFNIINRVTIKKKDWDKKIINSTGPTLLVINRAFLTLGKKYNELKKEHLDLVLHDECHNTTSSQCHDFLLKCKSIGVPIVGFSATPLRTGKNDKSKLLEIYGNKDNELELLTNYNMIYAISKNLILPPEFYWYQIEIYNKDKLGDKNIELITQQELGAVLEILNHIVPLLPNKKIIAWCGTIELAKKWKTMIESNYKQREHLVNFTFGLDTSESKTDDYNNFKKSDGYSILLCANKHREGSDIRLLDACIFLDKVKDRGAIPFIQSIGRVLRVCSDTPGKTKGVVIDGFIKESNTYEKQFVDKIIGYYMALENLTGISEEKVEKTKYEQYVEINQIVQFDKERNVIDMKLGSNIIKIHCNKLEWDKIIEKFDTILQDKIKLSVEDNFKHKAQQILRDVFGFNQSTNFNKAYKAISSEDKIKYNLPDIETDDYIKIFGKKSWFEFLEITHNYYPNKISGKKALKKLNIKLSEPTKNWRKWIKLDNKLPPYPTYVWDDFTWNYFIESNKIIV
jgi:superfamily II DNA or RNA helicase